MSQSLATILGGAAGGLIVVALGIGFLWYCMLRLRKFSNKSSETGSSDPSALVELNTRGGSVSARDHPLSEAQGARQYALEELEQATNKFSESNLIGEGSFGLVYKGLLHDGTVVAVKRRLSAPQYEFVEEVNFLAEISHRNLVTLLGYNQEDGFQMLVFEYLPNGSVYYHLHGKSSATQLEFRQRLSIALGAAKGLCHLHCLNPPLIHKNFKTSNVLVDENFIAKVADAGIIKILERIDDVFPLSRISSGAVFRDPEDGELGMVSEMSDIYSFGVFLSEIVSGEDASQIDLLGSGENLVQKVEPMTSSPDFILTKQLTSKNDADIKILQSSNCKLQMKVKSRVTSNNIVDSRLAGRFTLEGMKDLISLTLRCLSTDKKGQPNMKKIVSELDLILANEMRWRTVMGESTSTVTLGSQLFTSG